MQRATAWMLAAVLPLISLPALACGAGFGTEVTINPQQKIALTYRNGEETYIFKPHFCGKATDFGLILPVPSTLTHDPSLTDASLMDQLDVVTAPTVKTVEQCESSGCAMGSDNGSAAPGVDKSASPNDDGVDVISTGQVGDFQWQLLKADSAQSFTDWLDASQFSYPTSATTAFDHYVQAGWYFVAFSVKAGANAPPAGYRLCGDFGPIQLSFNATQAVIPARMAAASDTQSNFFWRLFVVSAHQQSVTGSNSGELTQTLRYAGAISAEDLGNAPAAAAIATQGEWLTAIDLNFYAWNLTDDFNLVQTQNDATYRSTTTVYQPVTCGDGCSMHQAPRHHRAAPAGFIVLAGLALIGAARRRRRVRQGHV